MAENSGKVWPGGIWYNDTPKERFEHVKEYVNRFINGVEDKKDLEWNVKNAILNRVYFSEDGAKYFLETKKNSKRFKEIQEQLSKDGYLSNKFLDTRKYTAGKAKLWFEHMVPWRLVMEKLVNYTKNNELTFEKFEELRSKLNICVVTREENRKLDKFKSSMPDDIDWEKGDEFARYNKIGIKIYKI